MIVWIIIVLAVIIAVINLHHFWVEDGPGFGVGAAFVTLIFGAFLVGVCGGIGAALPATDKWTETYDLEAIGSDPTTEGRFYFLGGGYINGDRAISYIWRDDQGGVHVDAADGDRAVVWEDTPAEDAHVEVTKWETRPWWLTPWNYNHWLDWHEFHIPEGSVQSDYNISLD